MKKSLMIVSSAALLMFSTGAFAGDDWDLGSACEAYVDETPDTTVDCTCLVSDTGDDADILASFKAAATEDAELSEDAGAVFGGCSAQPEPA